MTPMFVSNTVLYSNHKEICKDENNTREEEGEKIKRNQKDTIFFKKKKWITEFNQLLECLLFPKMFYTEY